MSCYEEPLVSVVTPVYNGEPYISECIESVLAQTYQNFEYIIVNNCSSDRTLEIATKYTDDPRVRVETNPSFLPIIANHNRSFSLVSPVSKYCKVVSADDWLLPEALRRMVEVAESNPSVGLVGSYQLSGGSDRWVVRNFGLPYTTTFVKGRDMCRAHTLRPLDVFGNPTSTLYRSDLVRSTNQFFPNETLEADLSACFATLQRSDYGFVHQVLSCERVHQARGSTTAWDLNTYLPSKIGDLLTYGRNYLAPQELNTCVNNHFNEYYRFLASSALNFRSDDFWAYHRRRLNELGYPLSYAKLAKAISRRVISLMLNPMQTARNLLHKIGKAQTPATGYGL